MKGLLEEHFGKHYGSTKHVLVNCRSENGQFTIMDSIGCRDCKVYTPDFETMCDKTVAHINSKKVEVQVIELEAFLNEYDGLKAIPSGKKCDLLMHSENKVVFCDMTCSNPKYISEFDNDSGEHKIGKRLTVRGQIENSINLLCNVPEIATAISSYTKRIALFAYREKVNNKMSNFDNLVASKMNTYGLMQIINCDDKMISDLSNGFQFTEVRYPEVYMW